MITTYFLFNKLIFKTKLKNYFYLSYKLMINTLELLREKCFLPERIGPENKESKAG